MKTKLQNMFSPSKNWKTTLILIMAVSIITFFLTVTVGFRFNNGESSETFRWLAKWRNSLGYIREIYYQDNGNASLYSAATFYASIADYLLTFLLFWFLIVIGFVINQFRFTKLVSKTRRVINSSIVLASALILMIMVFNMWISYFQSISVLNMRSFENHKDWTYSWQTVVMLTIVLFIVLLIVAMSIYNLFVEVNTKYVSFKERNSIQVKKTLEELKLKENESVGGSDLEDTSESLFSE